jgi:putative hemolysin
MNAQSLFWFVILLLALILCSFLGSRQGFTTNSYSNGQAATVTTNQGNTYGIAQGPQGNIATANVNGTNSNMNSNYDNYNHFDGTSYPTIFYGPDGGTARVIQTGNDNTIVITYKNGTTDIYYIDNDSNTVNINTYYGPNGGSAKIITQSDGKQAVELTTPDGSKILYTEDNTYVYNSQDDTLNSYDVDQYYGPNGGQATTISGPQGNAAAVTTPNGNTYAGTNSNTNQYYGQTGAQENTYAGTNYDSSAYYNSLPPGVPKSQIPDGQEDLYILKSEVVPPVCPVCPEPIVQCPDNYNKNNVPPCPPCARCPEPAFDCKKVPNYNAFNPDYMPVPVLNDFSSFGM